MSEEKLRALLAEARETLLAQHDPQDNIALTARIDAALRMSEDQISIECLREDAFTRGAEAMREAAARVAEALFVPGTVKQIRDLPVPEDKP